MERRAMLEMGRGGRGEWEGYSKPSSKVGLAPLDDDF